MYFLIINTIVNKGTMMNKNLISIILIIFGGYLFIGNTILSFVITYKDPHLFNDTMSFEDFWTTWWENYGIPTVITAVLGIVLIMIGLNIYKRKS